MYRVCGCKQFLVWQKKAARLACLPVVQRVDSVSEGIANYGGKIVAVETDLKKLGKSCRRRNSRRVINEGAAA